MDELEIQLRKNLANNLRINRAKERLSQEQLAEKANLTQTYIYKIENELVNPSIFVMYKLSKALHISIDDLLK